MTALVAAGVVSHSYVLTTRGRRTGRTRRNPVIVVELDARVGWSPGRGRVVGPQCARQRAGKREPSRPDEELHHPGGVSGAGGTGAQARLRHKTVLPGRPQRPVESFVAEAEHHPEFELVPISSDSTTGEPP